MLSPTRKTVLFILLPISISLLLLFTSRHTITSATSTGSSTILIDAVLYDGAINDDEEAVRLRNISNQDISLASWSLYDGARQTTLPTTLTLPANSTIWIAKDTAAFTAQFGFPPDYQTTSWLGLTNSGDELFLRDETNLVIDALVYENGDTASAGSNWQSAAIFPYTQISNGVDGQILYRKLDPITGVPVPDTNTAADWAQDPHDLNNGRRLLYPGWDHEQFFFPAVMTETAVLTIAIAPDNAYETVIHHINQAQSDINIETHTLENIEIGQALINASQRGVTVTILLEGSPPGGIGDDQKYICQQLQNVGGNCWYMISDKDTGAKHRYYYIHAKFMIIDNKTVMVSSENFSPNSLPSDDKSDGTWGRRGVVLFTDATSVINEINQIWQADFDLTAHQDLTRAHGLYVTLPPDYSPPIPQNPTTYTVHYPEAVVYQDSFLFELIQSPENTLYPNGAILGLLSQVQRGDTILVQQLYERPYWSNLDPNPNLRLDAYLAAARRGATVRVLLDDYFDTPSKATSNTATCTLIKQVAREENLDIQCQLANPAGLGIHNKMILAEINGRGYIHVGSINGSEQSHKGNRELALQVQSDAAYSYLADMFNRDWVDTIYLPILSHNYIGPASYPLISEILYNPAGPDHDEFIELVNPTHLPIDLSNYSLSDALLPTDFADLRRFPAGTTLASQETIVVTQQATAFHLSYGFWPDFEILSTSPLVPDMIDDSSWGDPATFLQLGNSGDLVLLRDSNNNPVDVIAYGTKQYQTQPNCLPTETGHSLRRTPYWRDTDDCLADFVAWPAPDPNQLP